MEHNTKIFVLSTLVIIVLLNLGCGQTNMASDKEVIEQVQQEVAVDRNFDSNQRSVLHGDLFLSLVVIEGSEKFSDQIESIVKIDYPQVIVGTDDTVVQKINEQIEEKVLETFLHYHNRDYYDMNVFHTEIKANSISDAVHDYFDACQVDFEQRFGVGIEEVSLPENHYVARVNIIKSTVYLNERGLLSLSLRHQNEYGGAHPIYWEETMTFDTKTGRLLDFGDMFSKKKLSDFYRYEKEQLIKNRRHENQFSEIQRKLEQKNFGPSLYAKKFYLTPSEMVSVYQDYEVTSHAEAEPAVHMKYEELSKFMSSDSPLQIFVSNLEQ